MKLALMGISGAGKDYLAEHLCSIHDFTRLSFSDQLKELATNIYPWLKRDYPPLVKEEPLDILTSQNERITASPREIWLHLNHLRNIENSIFIRMLDSKFQAEIYSSVVISDLRTSEELTWCRANDFKVIYIRPSKSVYQSYNFDEEIERNKSHADYVFENRFDGIESFEHFFVNEVKNEL
jgi:hypothetical protein